jgi:hypothetical protein
LDRSLYFCLCAAVVDVPALAHYFLFCSQCRGVHAASHMMSNSHLVFCMKMGHENERARPRPCTRVFGLEQAQWSSKVRCCLHEHLRSWLWPKRHSIYGQNVLIVVLLGFSFALLFLWSLFAPSVRWKVKYLKVHVSSHLLFYCSNFLRV